MDIKRLLVLLLSAGLIVWLCFSKKGSNRSDEVNQALRIGTVGQLSVRDNQYLLSLLQKIMKGAHFSTPFSLNRAFDAKKELHFFTCEPQAIQSTNCSKGNAIFDAELNAIFLDKSLVVPKEWLIYDPDSGIKIKADELPFLRTYLEFIILHELGHYKLHKVSAGFFDADKATKSSKWRRYEHQADSFAVETMSQLIAKDSTNTFFAPGTDATIELKVDSTTSPRSKTITGLADIGQNMTIGMLFGLSPYSAFYQDAAHPTFIERSKGFLNSALKMDTDKNSFTEKGEYIRNFLERIEQVAQNNALVEVTVPKPLLNLNFDQKGIFIQTVDSNVFHADYNAVTPVPGPGTLKKVVAQALKTKKENRYEFRVDRLFTLKNNRTFSVSNNDSLKEYANGQGWLQPHFPKFNFSYFSRVIVQPQPAYPYVFIDGFSDAYRFAETQITSFPKNEILKQVISKIKKDAIGLEWGDVLIGKEYFYLIITNKPSGTIAGLATVDLKTFSLKNAEILNMRDARLDKSAFNDRQSRILVDENDNSAYIVTSQLADKFKGKFGLFRLSSHFQPQLVFMKDFLYEKNNNDQLKIEPELWNNSVAQLSASTYLLNWDSDSIYLLNLTSKTADPIFHPGSETFQMRVARNGMVAIFSPGCYKFYILWPGHSDGTGPAIYIIAFLVLSTIILFTFIKIKK